MTDNTMVRTKEIVQIMVYITGTLYAFYGSIYLSTQSAMFASSNVLHDHIT